jgi:hypothetical protein
MLATLGLTFPATERCLECGARVLRSQGSIGSAYRPSCTAARASAGARPPLPRSCRDQASGR